jgi:hypothetical protein
MGTNYKGPFFLDPEYLERLKLNYMENAVSLAELFAQRSIYCVKQGDNDGAKAREYFEHFF